MKFIYICQESGRNIKTSGSCCVFLVISSHPQHPSKKIYLSLLAFHPQTVDCAKPRLPRISASVPVRSRPFAGAREAFGTFAASVQFTHVHVPLLENLLRQHELLTAEVTVSSVRHGEGRGGVRVREG